MGSGEGRWGLCVIESNKSSQEGVRTVVNFVTQHKSLPALTVLLQHSTHIFLTLS
jgi:hypothetical protein